MILILEQKMKIETIDLTDDVVEVLYNENLKKPYMIRLTNFNNERYEMVLDRKDIEHLADFLHDYVENKN